MSRNDLIQLKEAKVRSVTCQDIIGNDQDSSDIFYQKLAFNGIVSLDFEICTFALKFRL
jgi:hypothetical protein